MNARLIYLLEDNQDDIYLVKELLSQHNGKHQYAVNAFETIESLRDAVAQLNPEAILMDLNLPQSRGLETLLRVKDFAAHIPIIVLTGMSDEMFGEKAIQLGAQDYIPKHELSAHLLRRTIVFSKERFDMQRNLENLISLDRLTMLNNRGALDKHLHTQVQDAQRYGKQFAMLFIDLDNFKTINDELGHQAGDQLLRLLASKLKMYKRSSDFVARYGGDEFVVIAPNIDNPAQLELFTRYKHNLLADNYCLQDQQGNMHEVTLELSIGAVLFPDHGDGPTELLSCADKVMYQAKTQSLPFLLAQPTNNSV
jgi:diguanylate cyclase (GGDEF)-like protein